MKEGIIDRPKQTKAQIAESQKKFEASPQGKYVAAWKILNAEKINAIKQSKGSSDPILKPTFGEIATAKDFVNKFKKY